MLTRRKKRNVSPEKVFRGSYPSVIKKKKKKRNNVIMEILFFDLLFFRDLMGSVVRFVRRQREI